MNSDIFFPLLRMTLTAAQATLNSIPSARRQTLDQLAAWIAERARAGSAAELVFICTHNSRRSHFGQIWAQTAAAAFGLQHVRTYSGGTEATAFHPNAVNALRSQGFEIRKQDETDNPLYLVQAGPALPVFPVYSKRYDDSANPSSDFAAVMTCSDADEACPFIPGAGIRFSTPYDDPKASDGTGRESIVYAQRSLQIASEMLYAGTEAQRHKGTKDVGASHLPK
ncbi:MAG: protein-tyrosine-phosphatase [Bacteroidota bacterium]